MRQAASMMAARMRLYKRLAQQAQERGDSSVELNVREMWETGDEEALAAFDAATNILNGAQPLPLEIPA